MKGHTIPLGRCWIKHRAVAWLMVIVAFAAGLSVPGVGRADPGDLVEIMLCYQDRGDVMQCSETFLDSCLTASPSAVEQPGVEAACLDRLRGAWDGIHGGLLRRARTTYSGEQKFLFTDYVEKWKIMDEAACRFNSSDIDVGRRDQEVSLCMLGRALKRAEFLITEFESAQGRGLGR